MSFYDILTDLRVALGLTPAEIERRCGVGSNLLAAWKKKPSARPQPHVLDRIAAGVGIEWTRDPLTGDVAGWRAAGPSGVRESTSTYAAMHVHAEPPRSIVEMALSSLRDYLDAVRAEYAPDTYTEGHSMHEDEVALYETMFLELSATLEIIRNRAEFEVKQAVLEFERELARHGIKSYDARKEKQPYA